MTDYISREAFAAEMKERQTEARKWLREAKDHDTAVRADAVLSFLCEAKLTLDKIPAADVREVKKAKWIKTAALAPFEDDRFECSVCGSWPWWCGVTDANLPSFCPNCGSDMREEQT